MPVNHKYMDNSDEMTDSDGLPIPEILQLEFRDSKEYFPTESCEVNLNQAIIASTPIRKPYVDIKGKIIYKDIPYILTNDPRDECIKARCREIIGTLNEVNSLKFISKNGEDPMKWTVNFYEFVEFIQRRFQKPEWKLAAYAIAMAKRQREYIESINSTGNDNDSFYKLCSHEGILDEISEQERKYGKLFMRIMDKTSDYYSPKLACAIFAWSEAQTLKSLNNEKDLIAECARKHRGEYTSNAKGKDNISDEAIKQIAYIANWNPNGGARKTPG